VDRIAAMMLGDDGDPQPPANHHVSIVALDDRYLVDVGMGVPTLRRPLPIDGRVRTDEVGVSWRVAESDRPDSEYVLQYTKPGDDEWSNRYVFNDVPRELRYFEATCEFLATAPESPFTGDPVVTRATDDGHMKLTTDSLRRYDETGTTETDLTEPEWWDRLETDFGLDLREKPVQGANR
jgi:N-hydroxyarylamine O-acetyltransferase